jgi:type IV pilus assembly protein PilV
MVGKKIIPMSGLRNNKGFTLVEIMIAIFILVIALLGLISVTVMVIKGNSFSKTMTTATTLAKDKIEQLKNTSYGSLAGSTDYAKLDSTVQATQTTESIYTRRWIVNNNSPAAGMATTVVTVTWNWQDTAHNVTLSTIIAEW